MPAHDKNKRQHKNERGSTKREPPTQFPEQYSPSLFPPLYPSERAKVAADAALKGMNDYPELIAVFVEDSGAHENQDSVGRNLAVYKSLLRAANIYWHGRLGYEQGRIDSLKTKLKEIKESSDKTQLLCAKPDVGDSKKGTLVSAEPMIWGLLNKRLQIALNDNLAYSTLSPSPLTRDPLRLIEFLLKELSTACKKVEESLPGRGSRRKGFIADAAERLVNLWQKSGRKFKFNFGSAPGHGGVEEFTSSGVQFVWKIMQAIDPNLEMGEVGSALKKASSRRTQKSRNSA
jgi:hypothetical protein